MHHVREWHHTSASIWKEPRAFLAEFRRDVRQSPELAWQLFMRNVRARYRQSFTGYLWAFIPPLAWAALFLVLRSAGQLVGGGSHYAAHLVVGLVFWQLFIESAQTPLRIFAEARPMLGKLRFPREALVAAAILEVGLQFLVRVPLLVAAWLMTPGASAERWWLAPVSVAGLVVTGCLVGIILLPLSLLYEDVAPALALASGFWLLITPVAWSAPTAGFAATLAEWNPAAVLVTVARTWWLGFGEAAVPAFAAVTVSASAILLISWMMARVAFPHLIARFGS